MKALQGDVRVDMDGAAVTQVASLEVESTAGFEADVARFSVPNPENAHTALFRAINGKRLDVAIQGPVVFRGLIDTADFTQIPGRRIAIEGRDFTSILIDETITAALAAKLSGKPGSTCVERIAREYGFTAQAERTTRTWSEACLFPEGTTVWSGVAAMAEKEGFDAYVTQEKVIVFRRRQLDPKVSRVFFVPSDHGQVLVPAGASVPSALSFHEDKNMSLALKVRVIGFDPKRKRRISFTAESRLRNRPNYKMVEITDYSLQTSDAVRSRAESELVTISRDLVTGSLSVPVDPGIARAQTIQVRDRGNPLEGSYFVTKVRHGFEGDESPFETTVEFASKPLAISQDIEIKPEPASKGPAML